MYYVLAGSYAEALRFTKQFSIEQWAFVPTVYTLATMPRGVTLHALNGYYDKLIFAMARSRGMTVVHVEQTDKEE